MSLAGEVPILLATVFCLGSGLDLEAKKVYPGNFDLPGGWGSLWNPQSEAGLTCDPGTQSPSVCE